MAMQHIFFASTARSSSTLRCHSFLGVVGGVWAGACGGWALVLHHGDEVDDLLDGPVGEHLLVRDAGAGLQVLVSRSGTRVPVIRGSVASIYLDEMRMDASFLNSIPVNDIAMIKVIKGPFVGAIGNGGGGVIAIYTFRGDEEGEEHDSE